MFELLNIDTLSSLQNHLSSLTGLSLSMYDEKGSIILPPVKEDKFLSAVRSSPRGREEYNNFFKTHIEQAVQRRNVSLIKGPASQYYFFIPVHIDNLFLIITGSGGYPSAGDFEDFYKKEGQSYGLLPQQLKAWYHEIIIRDDAAIHDRAMHIQSIFNLVLRVSSEGSLKEKRYKLMKTVLGLVTNTKLDKQEDELYDMLADITLFLFNAESVSVMVRDNDVFRPVRTAGILKEHLESLPLKITGIVSEVIEKQRSLYSESAIELLRLGLGDEVASLYAFPIIWLADRHGEGPWTPHTPVAESADLRPARWLLPTPRGWRRLAPAPWVSAGLHRRGQRQTRRPADFCRWFPSFGLHPGRRGNLALRIRRQQIAQVQVGHQAHQLPQQRGQPLLGGARSQGSIGGVGGQHAHRRRRPFADPDVADVLCRRRRGAAQPYEERGTGIEGSQANQFQVVVNPPAASVDCPGLSCQEQRLRTPSYRSRHQLLLPRDLPRPG